MNTPEGEEDLAREMERAGVLAMRRGPGANCSSIGSAVEMLFLSATVGVAALAAIVAALRAPENDPGEKPPENPAPREGTP